MRLTVGRGIIPRLLAAQGSDSFPFHEGSIARAMIPSSNRLQRLAYGRGSARSTGPGSCRRCCTSGGSRSWSCRRRAARSDRWRTRSEEHTSELQSRQYLVCRLLLEKKKKNKNNIIDSKKKKKKTNQ